MTVAGSNRRRVHRQNTCSAPCGLPRALSTGSSCSSTSKAGASAHSRCRRPARPSASRGSAASIVACSWRPSATVRSSADRGSGFRTAPLCRTGLRSGSRSSLKHQGQSQGQVQALGHGRGHDKSQGPSQHHGWVQGLQTSKTCSYVKNTTGTESGIKSETSSCANAVCMPTISGCQAIIRPLGTYHAR